MAKMKNGSLILSKKEKESLYTIYMHTKINMSWGEGGSFNCEDKKGNFVFDKKEAKKAELGLNIINFILQITK